MGQVRVGTASWTDRTLLESGWYPPEADTPEQRLRYYARQFGLVEVDATYYAMPAEQTAALWARADPGRFHLQRQGVQPVHPPPHPGDRAASRPAPSGGEDGQGPGLPPRPRPRGGR